MEYLGSVGIWVAGGGLIAVGAFVGRLSSIYLNHRKVDEAFDKGLRNELRRDVDRLRLQMDAERALYTGLRTQMDAERAICDNKLANLTERIRNLEKQLLGVQNESRKNSQGICRVCSEAIQDAVPYGSAEPGDEGSQ